MILGSSRFFGAKQECIGTPALRCKVNPKVLFLVLLPVIRVLRNNRISQPNIHFSNLVH